MSAVERVDRVNALRFSNGGVNYCADCFFFFSSRRRHTRFDCDWSSDVCSSDLSAASADTWRSITFGANLPRAHPARPAPATTSGNGTANTASAMNAARASATRSEERRGGEEGRSRWAPDHLKKKK